MEFITPNDIGIISESDSKSIQNAVDTAHKKGCAVLIPRLNARTGEGIWIIDEAVLLPSDIEVILDNCHLKLADGIYDNIFRNANIYDRDRNFINLGRQRNIHIKGIGNAIIDGGNHNGLLVTQATNTSTRMQPANMFADFWRIPQQKVLRRMQKHTEPALFPLIFTQLKHRI